MIILKFIDKILAEISIILIKIYQYTISPDKGLPSLWLKGKICAHEPHCSKYSVLSFKRYGFFSGLPKVIERVFSCVGSKQKIYDPHKYNVVFFSSAPIGVPFLKELYKNKHFDIKGIVTNPDEKSGRGMKLKSNIIKTEGEKLFTLSSGAKSKDLKVILLHGKDTNSKEKRYPRVKQQLEKRGFSVNCPDLPNSKDPDIKERLKEINKLKPDENTILIGHSRGGVAALRRLEKNNQKVKKVILVAANDGKSKYITHGENNKGFYTKEGYNFEKIKQNCKEFTVFHSKDDKRVNYEYGINNVEGLNAKLYSFENKNHFGGNDKYNYKAITFPQLVNETLYDNAYYPIIQTPNSLRLDSKKYAEEAHNFKLRLEAKKPDYLVVIAYGKIIPKYILDIPKIAPINVHGSLLPKYRGASPIQSVFLNNEEKSGITIMKMDAKMDTGNMINKLSTKLKFNRTTGDLIERMKQKGPKFLNKTLISYGKRLLGEVKQNEKQATYCQKIEKEDGEINIEKDSLQKIYKKYRAYSLRPKIYFNTAPFTKGGKGDSIKPKRVIIEKLILNKKIFETEKNKPIIKGKELNKAIINISFKPEGKKSMNRESFKSGYLK